MPRPGRLYGSAHPLPKGDGVGSLSKKQEVRTLMTVTVTGSARIQEFIVPTPVVSG
ncbi:hypothetical protein BN2537_4437 [Streptomyces venezuelae]|nr:hypothetical protein BN2537_4437 [Streptomyces venezuelae]